MSWEYMYFEGEHLRKADTPQTELPARASHRNEQQERLDGQRLCYRFGTRKASRNKPDPRRIMYARILGSLILEGPSDQARDARPFLKRSLPVSTMKKCWIYFDYASFGVTFHVV